MAPGPGSAWLGGFAATDESAEPTAPVAVFKTAGWRRCRVVAVWAVGQSEPWRLLTDLPATADRLRDYAQRWAIERLFLTGKSHGWDLEASGLRAPARVGRLVSGLVLATWWRIALALPVCFALLADLAARAGLRPIRPVQLPLPGPVTDPASTRAAPLTPATSRPWPAKFSIASWGAKIARETPWRTTTPARCWSFPDWVAPLWSTQCRQVYALIS